MNTAKCFEFLKRTEVEKVVCELDSANRFYLILPDGPGQLADIDLSRDRTRELQEVEE